MKELIKPFVFNMLKTSLSASVNSNGLAGFIPKLENAVPDITKQYSTSTISSDFERLKARSLHSFQMSITTKAIEMIKKDSVNIVDIGDSSGTHLSYMQAIHGDKVRPLSVNIDPIAVEKIKSKGLEAIHSRAEELSKHDDFKGRDIDIFVSYEMLEHLFDPIKFLSSLAKSDCDLFVITVPFLRQSRVGFHQLRRGSEGLEILPENTHFLELSPLDWKLVFEFSGWDIVHEDIFYQHPPLWHPLFFTKFIWRYFDYEGFYGVILKPNKSKTQHLQNWEA